MCSLGAGGGGGGGRGWSVDCDLFRFLLSLLPPVVLVFGGTLMGPPDPETVVVGISRFSRFSLL